MHNHLGKQLVIQDSKSADLTPMIKLLSGSPCVHAVRNHVTQQYTICTKCNRVYTWLYKINIRNIYISVKTVTRSYIISIYSVKTVTRSNTDKHQIPTVADHPLNLILTSNIILAGSPGTPSAVKR